MNGARLEKTPPLDPAGFCASWARLGAPRRILLAVSGGADSMAMMRLAAPLHASGQARIDVASVDHGLRAGARAEAEFVGAEARALGLGHAVLQWRGAKPATGVQAAARNARYALLIAHAAAIGADAIATAHTADDQAETVFMRRARRSGPRGLSGMAESSAVALGAGEPILLLRPLLRARRAGLRAFMTAAGAAFIDDPGNDDTAFERVRVRRDLARLESEGAQSVTALCAAAVAAAAETARIEAAENARFDALCGAFDEEGGARFAVGAAAADAGLLARLVHAVGGGDHPPAPAQAAAALARLSAGKPATLGGAMLKAAGEGVIVFREPAAAEGRAGVAAMAPLSLASGARALWDGRFVLSNPYDRPVLILPFRRARDCAALGAEEAMRLAAAPALFRGDEFLGLASELGASHALAPERFYRRVNRFPEIT